MWFTLALLSALFLGCNEVAKKEALRDNAVIPVLFVSIVLGGAMFLPLQLLSAAAAEKMAGSLLYIPPVSAKEHGWIVIKSVVVLASWVFGFFATKYLPLTISAPIKATRPAFVVLGAVAVFGESLGLRQWCGVAVVLGALIVLSNIHEEKKGRAERNGRTGADRWIWFGVVSTLLGAASALWDKFLIQHCDRLAVQVYSTYYQALLMLPLMAWMWYPKRHTTARFRWRWTILFTALFLNVADFLYFYALSEPDALISVISTVRRSGVVVPFIAGALLFREKRIGRKAVVLAFVLAGVVLLYWG